MAAGDFTSSVALDAQIRLEAMYANPNISDTAQKAGTAYAARAVLARQTAQTAMLLNEQGKIVGAQAWYYLSGAADLAEGSVPSTSSCDVPTGAQGQTAKQDVDLEMLAWATAQVRTNRSDNLIQDAEEMAKSMADICARLRYQINRNVVLATLNANGQTNLDDFMNNNWTQSGSHIDVPEADFTWENLNEFRIVAENNNFSDYFFLSGRLFNDNKWLAMLNAQNETFRQQMRAWGENEIYFDTRDLDDYVGTKTAFAVDANSYAFINVSRHGSIPTRIEGEKEIYVWAIPDPTGLVWNKNGVLTPVMYEFEMQLSCSGRDALGFHKATKNLYGRVIGAMKTAPAGQNGETGTLIFQAA